MSDIFDHEADAWGSLEFGDEYPRYRTREPLRCRKCGKVGFSWVMNQNRKWWLWDREKRTWHACKET